MKYLYSVALFLENHELPGTVRQRLQLHQVWADNSNEALGMVIRDPKRKDQSFPIVYHLCERIDTKYTLPDYV